jgi:glyoxalase family protein
MVKKTVNFDQPDAYHLYFGDEQGSPGSILTWFEFAGAAPGKPGLGDIHTIQLGVASDDALGFWEERLESKGYPTARSEDWLRFEDDDGLRFELVVAADGNPPLRASHPEVPSEHAIVGIEGARAYSAFANVEEKVLTDTLGFTYLGDGEYRLDGDERHFHFAFDQAQGYGEQGAGSVHHIAWASEDDDHLKWRERVGQSGGFVTDVRDRDYFKSVYFREPRGVLFEIATMSPGFAVDEDPERLGEALRLPKQHEHMRAQLEQQLRPVVNPRTARRETVGA